MLIIITRTTIKKRILKHIVKETKKLKWYTKKRNLSNTEEGNNEGMGTMGEDIRNTATRKMADVILNFTVITLYVNVINNLKWIKKHDTTILSLSVKYIL